MSAIDAVLARLDSHKLRQSGPDRWRACCPAHGGSNPSALSIGVGDNGAVLLKCWHGCSADEVAGALGLELSDLFPPKTAHAGPAAKRRLISDRQALDLLHEEAQLVAMVAINVVHGELTTGDIDRVLTAAGRVSYLRDEVMA